MKNKTYCNAVEHLDFSDDLYKKVMEKAPEQKRPVRFVPVLIAAVLIISLLASTALAENSLLPETKPQVEHTIPVQTLGTRTQKCLN